MTRSPWSACIALAAALLCGCEVPPTTEPTPVDRGAAIRRFWSLYREATAMRTRGDFETAAHLYEQTLQIDPNHEECLYYYGQSLQERADYGGARAAFERAAAATDRLGSLAPNRGGVAAPDTVPKPTDLEGDPREETHAW